MFVTLEFVDQERAMIMQNEPASTSSATSTPMRPPPGARAGELGVAAGCADPGRRRLQALARAVLS